jgi:hypothetical protein
LIKTYHELKTAFVEGRYDLCGLRAGKFCEVSLRVLQNSITGTYIPFGQKIPNFQIECSKLEQSPSSSGSESFRLLIPRALNFLYSLRNKRGIGHVGGDIDANEIDAITCVRLADWSLGEIIRVVHNLSIEEAQSLIDAIAERHIPVVWEVVGRKRILEIGLDFQQQVLLLVYSQLTTGVPFEDLFEWTEHYEKSKFRTRVLIPLHRQRLIEYDQESEFVFISPTGIQKVEKEILPKSMG